MEEISEKSKVILGCVYIVQPYNYLDANILKIGFTQQWLERFRQWSCVAPDLKLLRAFPCTNREEYMLIDKIKKSIYLQQFIGRELFRVKSLLPFLDWIGSEYTKWLRENRETITDSFIDTVSQNMEIDLKYYKHARTLKVSSKRKFRKEMKNAWDDFYASLNEEEKQRYESSMVDSLEVLINRAERKPRFVDSLDEKRKSLLLRAIDVQDQYFRLC